MGVEGGEGILGICIFFLGGGRGGGGGGAKRGGGGEKGRGGGEKGRGGRVVYIRHEHVFYRERGGELVQEQ